MKDMGRCTYQFSKAQAISNYFKAAAEKSETVLKTQSCESKSSEASFHHEAIPWAKYFLSASRGMSRSSFAHSNGAQIENR